MKKLEGLVKSETKIYKKIFDDVPKDTIEKKIIIDFLGNLPLENLKSIVRLKEEDLLGHLEQENMVLFRCEIFL